MRVAVDMDEVIADALPAQLGWLADRFGYALSLAECEGRRLSELLSAPHRDELEAHLHEGRFFGELLPMPGAEAALTLLNERTELFVTTAAMEYPRSLPFKFEWLRERFPFLDPLLRVLRRQGHHRRRLPGRRQREALRTLRRGRHPVLRAPQRGGAALPAGVDVAAGARAARARLAGRQWSERLAR